MSRGRRGLAAGEAVLGLVIEEPDHGFGLERRLEGRFGSAGFAYSTAYNALYRLEREGLVRAVGGKAAEARGNARKTAAARERAEVGETAFETTARETTYEATARGVKHFRTWVREPTAIPVLREELHAKIALCEPRDLPRMVEMVQLEQQACTRELDALRQRTLAEHPGSAPVTQRSWSELMALGVAHGEAAYWSGRIRQLSQLYAYLSELLDEARRRAVEESAERMRAGAR